jgi:ATP-binding cassette subfamily B protein
MNGGPAAEPDPPAPAAPVRPFTLDDIRAPADRSLRRLPRRVASSVRLSWRAARREFLGSLVLQLLSGAAVGGQLLLGRQVLASVLSPETGGDFAAVLPSLVALAAVSALVSFSALARAEQQRVLTELVGRYAVDQVLEVVTQVDLLEYERPAFHNRMRRAMVNAEIRPYQMAAGVLGIASALFAIAGIAGALLVFEPLFLLLVLVAYVPAWLASARASRVTHQFSVAQTERDRERGYLRMVLHGKEEAKEIRAFDLGSFLRARHDRLYDEKIADLRTMVRRRLRLGLVGGLMTSLLTAGAVAVLVWFVTSGRMTVASASAAAGAVLLLSQRLQALSSSAGTLYESALFLEDFTTFVAAAPALADARPRAVPPRRFGRLSVEDVSFTYPSRTEPSLRNVSLTLKAGEIVALVGPNGSGKTTLAKLLAGLYQPTSGAIRWDGVDAATFDPVQLRDSVAVIFQDFVKYVMSAGENIGLGRHQQISDQERIVEAARQAGAHDFLAGLAGGYGSRLGAQYAGGSDLSVGQWQRVALARAFFRDAPFIVLDEPTAALDPRGEYELFERIRDLAEGRTVLLISHRFSSVRSADRIFVLADGQVVEGGSHPELMDQNGLYAELFKLQAGAYGVAGG